jgi:molecular chaperone DnaK (HSP70)
MNRYFNQSNSLENALEDLSYLFENEYSIEENEETITFIIKYRRDLIKFVLDKVEDKIDLSYDSLPDQMKEIIDDNQLVLGIDLGTTYSCAAVMIDKNIIMIRNSLGSTTTPSYISFVNRNEVYVGELSKLLPSDEKNIIFNTKRLLGKNIEDNEIKEIIPKLPFKLKKDEKFNLLKICLNFKDTKNEEEKNKEEEFYPEQLSALILRKIINDSEFYLSKKIGRDIKIKNCVITVPAYFNQKQRESTLNSAKILGLNVRTMINEPTAASLAYAFQSLENADKKIIVIDFGGGTLDITLLRYRKDKDAIYCDVKFTYGNTNFGGEDFDIALMNK